MFICTLYVFFKHITLLVEVWPNFKPSKQEFEYNLNLTGLKVATQIKIEVHKTKYITIFFVQFSHLEI